MELLIDFVYIHFFLSAVALVLILIAKTATKIQKLLQACFVLFIPIIGPLFAIAIHVVDRLKPIAPSYSESKEFIIPSPPDSPY